MFTELAEEVTNWSIFTDSLREFVSNLSFNAVIVAIMMGFMVLGAIDKAQGNKRG